MTFRGASPHRLDEGKTGCVLWIIVREERTPVETQICALLTCCGKEPVEAPHLGREVVVDASFESHVTSLKPRRSLRKSFALESNTRSM